MACTVYVTGESGAYYTNDLYLVLPYEALVATDCSKLVKYEYQIQSISNEMEIEFKLYANRRVWVYQSDTANCKVTQVDTNTAKVDFEDGGGSTKDVFITIVNDAGLTVSGQKIILHGTSGHNASFYFDLNPVHKADSLHFNGSSSYIEIPHNNMFNTNNLTIEIWFKTYATNVTQTLFTKPTKNADCDIYIQSDNTLLWKLSKYQQDNLVSTTSVTTEELHHAVFTANLTNMWLYLDGKLESTKTIYYSPRPTNTHSIYIGNSIYWSNTPLNADIFLVAQYSSTWDSNTISQRYTSGLNPNDMSSNCVLFYTGKSLGNPIADLSGNGNLGTNYNVTSGSTYTLTNQSDTTSNIYANIPTGWYGNNSTTYNNGNITFTNGEKILRCFIDETNVNVAFMSNITALINKTEQFSNPITVTTLPSTISSCTINYLDGKLYLAIAYIGADGNGKAECWVDDTGVGHTWYKKGNITTQFNDDTGFTISDTNGLTTIVQSDNRTLFVVIPRKRNIWGSQGDGVRCFYSKDGGSTWTNTGGLAGGVIDRIWFGGSGGLLVLSDNSVATHYSTSSATNFSITFTIGIGTQYSSNGFGLPDSVMGCIAGAYFMWKKECYFMYNTYLYKYTGVMPITADSLTDGANWILIKSGLPLSSDASTMYYVTVIDNIIIETHGYNSNIYAERIIPRKNKRIRNFKRTRLPEFVYNHSIHYFSELEGVEDSSFKARRVSI